MEILHTACMDPKVRIGKRLRIAHSLKTLIFLGFTPTYLPAPIDLNGSNLGGLTAMGTNQSCPTSFCQFLAVLSLLTVLSSTSLDFISQA